MRTHQFKLGSLLLFGLFFLTFGVEAKRATAEKTKTISKSYAVNSDHALSIENKFGQVKVTTWDKNELSVDITIKVETKSESKLDAILDKIEIDIKEGKSASEFKTDFNEGKINVGNNVNKSFEINYDIKMPKSNHLKLDNQFGAFIINDLDGKADVTVKFGSATIGKLTHPESRLHFDFSDPINIQEMMSGELVLKYSKCELVAAKDLEVNSEFSNVNIDGVGNMEMNIKFGSASVDQIIDAAIHSNMSSIKIGALSGKGVFVPKYGSLSIDKVSKDMTEIDINGEFSPIDISFEGGSSFYADIYGSMASVSVPNASWEKVNKEGNSKSYRGQIGGNSNKRVNIRSSFGKVNVDF